jgi:signal transduction histidine kinase
LRKNIPHQNGNLTIVLKEIDSVIECHISDTGMEVAAEDIDKIFNQFYRSQSNSHPEIKGTGLGLSIVKKLCTLLNIEIVPVKIKVLF